MNVAYIILKGEQSYVRKQHVFLLITLNIGFWDTAYESHNTMLLYLWLEALTSVSFDVRNGDEAIFQYVLIQFMRTSINIIVVMVYCLLKHHLMK